MILTPTYHVFDMYKVHQDAELVNSIVKCNNYELDGQQIPQLNASASIGSDGNLNITICNLNPNSGADINIDLTGFKPSTAAGSVLTAGSMNSHNTFENPDKVQAVEFKGFTVNDKGLSVQLPKMSVVQLVLEQSEFS